jgi:hypothetical protein
MKIDFRIDWGYQMLYSRRHYHPFYLWDGCLECSGQAALKVNQFEYPPAWWGPCHSAIETPLSKPEWKSSTRRKISGIRVEADCSEDAVFKLTTLSGVFEFSAKDIIEKKRFSFHVGPKYAFCQVTVTEMGHLWFRPSPREGQCVFEAKDLPLLQTNSERMDLGVLEPGKTVEFPVDIKAEGGKDSLQECLCHIQAMILELDLPEGKKHARSEMAMEFLVKGKTVSECKHFFRYHDDEAQLLEDVWARFPVESAIEKISLKNCDSHYPLMISRMSFESKITDDLQMSIPCWALAGENLRGKIFSMDEKNVRISCQDNSFDLDLQPGWNEFDIKIEKPGNNVKIFASTEDASSEILIDSVYALEDETPEVMVGYDMTVVPHDDNGFMDWLLDYTGRTKLANTVVFRHFFKTQPSDDLLKRWGEICRKYRIYVQSVNSHHSNALEEGSGEYMHNAGRHEYPGVVYSKDPEKGNESSDMKEAYENYIAYLKADIDTVKAKGLRHGYGDASGGHRHSYLAGASFIRTETMVPHTQHLCSLARPAAEALSKGDWGVHIAIQHALQLYHPKHHLGQYFLSLYQPWMMGASVIYEEDCLFLLFKEERQCWDDALTKGKRDMTREFLRFVKTHPRKGRPMRSIAFFEGRYAAPFNGFICGTEQDPGYSVWGKFGNNSPEWGHGQPEKCRHLLDVLMPGASVQPLRQRFDKRRFFFSGTPYGDFDQAPVEASQDYLNQYSLILNLGWNTMIEEDYEKLKNYVAQGGALFTGLPQFSSHVKRDFLKDMEDLSLWNNGDLSELCGVKVSGKSGKVYKGVWNAAGREKLTIPELSRIPNDSPDEDGPCFLAELELQGAEIVVWDGASGMPLIVRHKYGKGEVYLICAWAYPGHEALSEAVSVWTAKLAREHRGEIYVEDPSREVFWNVWQENEREQKIMLLNTDWASVGTSKTVTVHTPEFEFVAEIFERQAKIITLGDGIAIEAPQEMHLEFLSDKTLRVHGSADGNLRLHKTSGSKDIAISFKDLPFMDIEYSF